MNNCWVAQDKVNINTIEIHIHRCRLKKSVCLNSYLTLPFHENSFILRGVSYGISQSTPTFWKSSSFDIVMYRIYKLYINTHLSDIVLFASKSFKQIVPVPLPKPPGTIEPSSGINSSIENSWLLTNANYTSPKMSSSYSNDLITDYLKTFSLFF